MKREVWFEKAAWAYIPCHWKGFAVTAAIVVPTVFAMMLAQTISDHLGYAAVDWLPFVVIFVPALLLLLGVAKRHS